MTPKTKKEQDEADDAARILRAIGKMPYGAMVYRKLVRVDGQANVFTNESLADYLEALQDVIEGMAEAREKERKELTQLDAEVRGVSAFLKRCMKEKD